MSEDKIRVCVGTSTMPFKVKDIKEVTIYPDETWVTLHNNKKYRYPSHECDGCGEETNNGGMCDDCIEKLNKAR